MKIKLLIILIIALATGMTTGLSGEIYISDWKLETSYLQTQDAVFDGDSVLWVASNGGVFSYNSQTEEIIKFNKLTGLSANTAKVITYDKYRDVIIVGYNDGSIDIIKKDKSIINISDLKKANGGLKAITDFYVLEDKILVVGEFGLTDLFIDPELSSLEQIFNYNFTQFAINDITVHNDTIWAATDDGIYTIDLALPLSVPTNWVLTDLIPFNPDVRTIGGLEFFDNELYCYQNYKVENIDTVYAVYKLEADSLSLHRKTEYSINSLYLQDGELYASTLFSFYNIDTKQRLFSSFSISQVLLVYINPFDSEEKLVITSNQGIYKIDSENKKLAINLNCLIHNNINSVRFHNRSKDIWLTAGGVVNRIGKDSIQYFTNRKFDIIPKSTSFDKVFISSKGEIYGGSQSVGYIKLTAQDSSYAIEHYSQENSPLSELLKGSSLTRVEDFSEDKNGNVWIANWGLDTPGSLCIVENGSSFVAFENQVSKFTKATRQYQAIANDENNTIWLGSGGAEVATQGLYFINTNNTLTDKSDDIHGYVNDENTENDLASTDINVIDIDKNGWLWVGTNNGVSFIVNSYSALDQSPNFLIESPDNMGDLNVNDLLIDPVDNKWFATESGVWVFDSEGTKKILEINKDNSPLTTNSIKAVELDKATGKIYIGTTEGLYIAQTNILEPQKNYSLDIYPQPFAPNSDDFLIIDGLAEESDIKISTIDGSLVRKLNVKSGRALWDGKTDDGNTVPQGVYMIITKSATGDQSSVTKCAVVYSR